MRKNIATLSRKIYNKCLEYKLIKYDKKICHLHTEWEDLTHEEKREIDKRDLYGFKIYKNVYGAYSKYFVTDSFYQSVLLPKLSKPVYSDYGFRTEKAYFQDKNYMDFFLQDIIKMPDIVLRNVEGVFMDKAFNHISKSKALEILNQNDELVFKESVESGHSKGVKKIQSKEFSYEIENRKANYVVQKIIKQHEFFSHYNASSVNVVRITSLFTDGKVHILSGTLRIGPPGAFCDLGTSNHLHPLIVGLDENGNLKNKAFDLETFFVYDNIFDKKIEGSIPLYNEMKKKIIEFHAFFPKYKIIGWDLTVNDKNEIICIEYNVGCPAVVASQCANGPIFGKKADNGKTLLEIILNE